jgi:hypothetical protein
MAVHKLLYGIELWCKRNINVKKSLAEETLKMSRTLID